jgi:hypothetical protein
MADEAFMLDTMAGTLAALTVLLFVARGHRSRSKSNTEISNNETSSSWSSPKNNQFIKGLEHIEDI